MSTNASFQLTDYIINHAKISFEEKLPKEIKVKIDPSGIFHENEHTFSLILYFTAFVEEAKPNIEINCVGNFKLQNINSFKDIPPFFFVNAPAILFPYLRAFISTLTIQCNVQGLVLPTYNLTELATPLKESTIIN